MSDQWAPTDTNDKFGLFAVSNVDGKTLVRLEADPLTGALIVTSTTTAGTQVLNEVVAGSGTSWTLAFTPNAAGVALYANGQRLTPTVDYSLATATITTVLSWSAGTVLADYVH